MKTIDKSSRVALYYQLMDVIIEMIEEGKLKEHDQIPSERELCDVYDISRATVRQAVLMLEKEGIIYKEHGKGTFVSPIKVNQDLLKFYSFTEEMRKIGKVVETTVLAFETIGAQGDLCRKMKLDEDTQLYKIVRVRYADHEPMMVVTTYVPCDRFPGLTRADLEENSMYDLFINRYKTVFSRAEETFQPVFTGTFEAELFAIDAKSPSMKIDRMTYENQNIIEYATAIARGDKFKYGVVLEK